MKKTICLLRFFGIWGGSCLSAAEPSSQEQKSFEHWFQNAFVKQNSVAPFSFAYDGISSQGFLSHWKKTITFRPLDAQRHGYTFRYEDPDGPLTVTVEAIVYHRFPAVDWVVMLTNRGHQATAFLDSIRSLDMSWQPRDGAGFVVHHSMGEYNSAASFRPLTRSLTTDSLLLIRPKGGRSSDGWMPFFNMTNGAQGIVLAIGWSGQWQAGFLQTSGQGLRVTAGREWTHLKLLPGETIRTPRTLLLFWQGEDDLRGNNLFRQLLIEHYLPRRDGKQVYAPVCASIDRVDPDGSYEGPHLRVMPELARRGFEVFWSDMDPQHWYPVGFPDGTGTWLPDPIKYPRGLAPIGRAAHENGLEYLLWFEPERVALNTFIDRTHPEFLMVRPGERNRLFKLQAPAARAWLIDHIDQQITAAQLDWLRWDMNIEPESFWRLEDPAERQGITEIRYIEGLYSMMDELQRRHPGLIIDLCASGGRRIDIEVLRRGLPLWHSDLQCFGPHPEAEQLQNGGLFRWLPLHGCGSFGYEPSYAFRSAMTSGNILVGHSREYLGQRFRQREKQFMDEAGLQLSPWSAIGPFSRPFGSVFTHAFPPEKRVDLAQRYEKDLAWTDRPDWRDAEPHYFDQAVEGAFYLYRTIRSAFAQTIKVYLGSDDGIHCWVNEQLIFVHRVNRPLNAGLDSTNLPLQAGENRLLLKITNHSGRSGFYFSLLAPDPLLGKLDTDFPETDQEVIRSIALYKKIRPYLLGDFYPLFPHDAADTAWYGYQFHRPGQRDGVVILFRRSQAVQKQIVRLRDLRVEQRLDLFSENTGRIITVNGPEIQWTILDAPGSEILFYRVKR